MGWLDRLLGTERPAPPPTARRDDLAEHRPSGTRPVAAPVADEELTDAQALERYRYMLRTAPPEALEQAHAEAFARLSPEQRRQVLVELTQAAPPGERMAAQSTSPEDPRALGRLATRTEMRQPGFMERTFGGGFGGSLLGSFAMGFVGSMVAHSFFSALDGFAPEEAPTQPEHLGDDDAIEDRTDDAELSSDDGDMGDTDFGGGDFDV
jgi:hypothetical protein